MFKRAIVATVAASVNAIDIDTMGKPVKAAPAVGKFASHAGDLASVQADLAAIQAPIRASRLRAQRPRKGFVAPRRIGYGTSYRAPLRSKGGKGFRYGAAPRAGYRGLRAGYRGPRAGYRGPRVGYRGLRAGYGAPRVGYGARNGAPRARYGAGYGAPRARYNAPRKGYGAGHGAGYASPRSGHGVRGRRYGGRADGYGNLAGSLGAFSQDFSYAGDGGLFNQVSSNLGLGNNKNFANLSSGSMFNSTIGVGQVGGFDSKQFNFANGGGFAGFGGFGSFSDAFA